MIETEMQPVKRCPKCGKVLLVSAFRHRAASRDGFSTRCRQCIAKYERRRRKRPTVKFYAWHYRHRPDVAAKRREARRLRRQRPDVREKEKARKKAYRHRHQEHLREKERQRRQRPEVRERMQAADRRRYAMNRSTELQRVGAYDRSPAGKQARHARRARYRQGARYHLDELAAMAVRRALEGKTFSRVWRDRFGYTAEAVRLHLLATLPEGCRVEDLGGLVVDHVRPRRGFSYERSEDPGFRVTWAPENLRLLPAAWHRLRA